MLQWGDRTTPSSPGPVVAVAMMNRPVVTSDQWGRPSADRGSKADRADLVNWCITTSPIATSVSRLALTRSATGTSKIKGKVPIAIDYSEPEMPVTPRTPRSQASAG